MDGSEAVDTAEYVDGLRQACLTKQLRPKEHGYLKLVIHDGRAAVTQDVPVSLISHPLGPGDIRLIRSAGALRLAFRIDAQYDLRYLSPVCALCV